MDVIPIQSAKFWENLNIEIFLGLIIVQKFFTKSTGLAIALLACHSCALAPALLVDSNEKEATPLQNQPITKDCAGSLPNLPIGEIRKNKSSKNVEGEADQLEEQGKSQQALEKYSEARTLYFGELGRASGRALWGDFDATMDINISIDSPTFLFKVGRAFAKNKQYSVAIACFSESLDGGISEPNDAIAYLNRGDAYERMGDKDKAKSDFQQAIILFKKYKQPTYQKLSEQRLNSIK